MESDWEARTASAQSVRLEFDSVRSAGSEPIQIRVISHAVEGLRHYGILVTPVAADVTSLPVVVYAHGGDDGVAVEEILLIDGVLKSRGHTAALVAPSFRDEPIRAGDRTFRSDGPPSPWDRDVDDAISLLSASIEYAPELDPRRVGIVGVSRGGGVGLLMAARDPRIQAVVEFFGPTDFFDDYAREIVEEALEGELRDLPGLEYLNQTVIQPWKNRTLSTEAVRDEMVRRSAVYFVDRLPAVQAHHGTADDVVAVSQAERLIEAMETAGRAGSSFEAHLYAGGRHDLFGLPDAVNRAVNFLSNHVIEISPAVNSGSPM